MADVEHELRDVDGVPVVWLHHGLIVDVAGCRHYQGALERIAGPKLPDGHDHDAVAFLVPEPENPHDRNAVRVEVRGEKVGYLPRDLAGDVQPGIIAIGAHYGRPVACHATISGGQLRPYKRGKGTIDTPFEVSVDFAYVAAQPVAPVAPPPPPPMYATPAPPSASAVGPGAPVAAPSLPVPSAKAIGMYFLAGLALLVFLFIGSAVVVGIARGVNAPPAGAPSGASAAAKTGASPAKVAPKPPAKR